MTDTLFVRIGSSGEDVSSIVLNEEGRLVESLRFGTLEDAASRADGRRVVMLVPGSEAVTTKASLPTTSQARLRQMLPFALEDTFAEDVDRLAFAVGPKFPSGAISVSVVANDKLETWLAAATAAGLEPAAIYVESDGVPNTPATLNMIVEGDTLLGRRPDQPPLCLQGLGLADAFAIFAASAEGEATVQHALIYIDAAGRERYANELMGIEASLSSLDVKLIEQSALPALAAKLVHEPGTNLLQGPYAPKSNWPALLAPWRVAASLLVALGVVSLLAMAGEYWSLERQDTALAEAISAACAAQFGTPGVAQCEAITEQRLRQAGESVGGNIAGFLDTLAVLAEFGNTEQRLKSLSYRNRVLDLQLTAPDVPALDAFGQAVSGTGRFSVSIQSTTPEGDEVEARLQIVGVEQ